MIANKAKLAIGIALLATTVPAFAQGRNRAPAIPTIAFGQTVNGQISSARSNECVPDAPNLRSYRFTVAADTRIEAVMQADDFDTLLEIGRLDGCEWISLGRNDDGSGDEDGLNSRLTAHLREAGTYILRASSYSDEAAGRFTLSLERLPAPTTPPPPAALTVGEPVEARLTRDDPMAASRWGHEPDSVVIGSGRHYHHYALTGVAGQSFDVTLQSDDFDAYLEAGIDGPLGFSVANSNDDGHDDDDGLNSRLRLQFERDGTVILRAMSYSSGTGAYTLTVTEAKAAE